MKEDEWPWGWIKMSEDEDELKSMRMNKDE